MCDNTPADIIFVDMEEEEDDGIGDTVTSFIKTLDKNRTEKKNLKDFMKLSLSQEVDKVSNLFKIQTQVKESKIKSVLDELKVYLAEMDIWQNQLQHKSQKNVELSKELEEKSQEKHDLETQLEHSSENYAELQRELEETQIDFESAKDGLSLMKSESEEEKKKWDQEMSIKEEMIEKTSREKLDLKTQLEHLSENYADLEEKLKSESEKEKGRWEQQIMVKEEMIERLASEIGRQSEKMDSCKEQLRVVSSEKEDVVKELSLSKWYQNASQEKYEVVHLKNIEAETNLEKLSSELSLTKQELCKVKVMAEKRQQLMSDLENLRKEDDNKIQNVVGTVKKITDDKSRIENELDLTKQELCKVKGVAENRQQLLCDLENVQKEDGTKMRNIVEQVKKITDDKSRIELEHKNCKQERESFEQKVSTQRILGQNQLNVIETLQKDLKAFEALRLLQSSQSESLGPLRKELEAKSEEVKTQSKLIADQVNKIKRLTENEEWFNLITEEQKQKSKVFIKEAESRVLECQDQSKLVAEERKELMKKIETFEEKVASLQKRYDETNARHFKTVLNKEKRMEGKESEIIELKKKVEDLKMEMELTEMNSETDNDLEQKAAENLDLKSKLENMAEKVKVAETQLENTMKVNIELHSKIEDIRKKVESSENELKMNSSKNLVSKKTIEMLEQQVKEKVENLKVLTESERSSKDQLKAVAEKLSLLEKEKVESLKVKECQRGSEDEMKEKLLLLEAEISDQSKDIIWYRTQAKSFNKANQELQKKLIESEDNLKPFQAESEVDRDVISDDDMIDMDMISDDEEKLEEADDSREMVVGDNSDRPSTSKQTSGQARQDEKRGQIGIDRKENSSSKRSRSRTPVEQSSKYRRVEQTEDSIREIRHQPIFGTESPLIKNRIMKGKVINSHIWSH